MSMSVAAVADVSEPRSTRLPLLEPPSESSTRRWVFIIFIVCYLACAPLYLVTSRVQRVPLPELNNLDISFRFTLPIQAHCLFPAAPSDEWTRWTTSIPSQLVKHLVDQSITVKSRHVEATLLEPRISAAESNAIVSAMLQQGSDFDSEQTQSLIEAFSSTQVRSESTSDVAGRLPMWRVIFVITDRIPPFDSASSWTMTASRTAFTYLLPSSTAAERDERLKLFSKLLTEMLETQSCGSFGFSSEIQQQFRQRQHRMGAQNHACAGSRSLSQRLSFTLLNDEGDERSQHAEEWTWNFQRIKIAYLSYFIRTVAPFATFTVDSSVLHYGHLSAASPTIAQIDQEVQQQISHLPQPIRERISEKQLERQQQANGTVSAHQLNIHEMKNLIGSIGEWNMQSPLVQSSMELLVYIPPKEQRPLFFNFQAHKDEAAEPSTSLFVPQYGGVLVLNAPGLCSNRIGNRCELDLATVSKEILQVFIEQIRHSLAFTQHYKSCPTCAFLPNRQTGVSAWELDLLSARVVHLNLAETGQTLQSLYDLLASVPHMPINSDIQELVLESIRLHDEARQHAQQRRWSEAGVASQASVEAAQLAFFHHDMLPALYFPDEHLYAVYLPLFLPITVPLFAALIKLLTKSDAKDREAKKKLIQAERQDANSSVELAAPISSESESHMEGERDAAVSTLRHR